VHTAETGSKISKIASVAVANDLHQTYTVWADPPFLDAIRFQLRHFGPWETLFAGFPTALLFDLLDAAREFATLELQDRLIDRFANPRIPPERRRRAKRAIIFLMNMYVRSWFPEPSLTRGPDSIP